MNHNSKLLLLAGRLLMAVHFVSEAVDKLLHWSQWVGVIKDAGFPIPSIMLLLVVTLLLVGAPLLVMGVFLSWAVGALLLFQIPTTLFFETTWYEKADSISVMGGLLLVIALMKEEEEEEEELPPTSQLAEITPLLLETEEEMPLQRQPDLEDENGLQIFVNQECNE